MFSIFCDYPRMMFPKPSRTRDVKVLSEESAHTVERAYVIRKAGR